MEVWLKSKGETVLRELGIKEGQEILDFGCGAGTYSLIASRIVGRKGRIYALDYDEESLQELTEKIQTQKIINIETIKTSKDIIFPLKDNCLDVVLLYDVYHLLDKEERIKLLKEIYRILKDKIGFLSYFATHIGYHGIDLVEVKEKMESYGFKLVKEFHKPMFHWNWIEEGTVYSYYKK
ncbi:MAG: class I SAM-dependent methyltransferase [Promethearchaeota archaeon]